MRTEAELNKLIAEECGCGAESFIGYDRFPDFTHSLNALFLHAVPNHKIPIVGVSFRYFPGGTECELTYMTEGGFDTEKSWIQAKSTTADWDGEAFRLSALALARALEQTIDREVKHDK